MPLINPDEIIKNNFKILSKRNKSPQQEKQNVQKKPATDTASIAAPRSIYLLPDQNTVQLEELMVHQASSVSLSTMEKTRSYSHGDGTTPGDISMYILEETGNKLTKVNDNENMNAPQNETGEENPDADKDGQNTGPNNSPIDSTDAQKPKEQKLFAKRKVVDDDRRRTAWIPCTCPQYKVSKELANKWDLQSIFFGKILVVKVIQLLFINLVVLASVFASDGVSEFFSKSHDWAYLAYGLFLALLLCIRWGVGYRSRWPISISIVLMVPMTAIIAFTSACVTVIYNSILIPLVTCTIFLTFIMLCFVPFLLRKSVMHRSTNVAGGCLAFLSSIILLFLKELESRPIGYWDFVSHVWLPGLLLSQIAVQITVFEIQRIIFGLCFNVSTKRWHIAAMYV